MLFREIINVYSENLAEPINTKLRRVKVIVKAAGVWL
jgi:hypothetical protein